MSKLCFVIAPIGDEGTEVRRRSDQVLTHIIDMAAKECGYETLRADKISEPGIITSQIIQHLLDDPLVIADMTGHNPNVFYELAVRHAIRKPVVQLIEKGEKIPFDVAATRTIPVDHHDLDSVAKCRQEMIRQIKAVEKDPADVDTPISAAIDVQQLRRSGNPMEKSTAEIISMLQSLHAKIDAISISPLARRAKIQRELLIEQLDAVVERKIALETSLKALFETLERERNVPIAKESRSKRESLEKRILAMRNELDTLRHQEKSIIGLYERSV